MRFLLILSLFFSLVSYANEKTPIKLLQIYDGDTIEAKIDTGNRFKIRLYGMDCAEITKNNRAYKQAYIQNTSIDEIINKGIIAKNELKKLSKILTIFLLNLRELIYMDVF